MDTIFALSSGPPPAAIALVRVSGAAAGKAGRALLGSLPAPRVATLRAVRDAAGDVLDRALTLWFPGPDTATGEDLLELHLHGGRAIVAAVQSALAAVPGLRAALPGEFTRRALANGRIDLLQTQGLADLLEAETEDQRRAALAATEGIAGATIAAFMADVAGIAATIESALDFSDEADVAGTAVFDIGVIADRIASDIDTLLARPSVERLRDGPRVVLAGPRNAGKSSLFNALLERDAAIVTPIAGTTRDLLEANVFRAGRPYTLIDTAGLAESTKDIVERIGIARAIDARDTADLVLWLGEVHAAPSGALLVHARSDAPSREKAPMTAVATSITNPESIAVLWHEIDTRTQTRLSSATVVSFHQRDRELLADASAALRAIGNERDPLLQAEHCRMVTRALAKIIGVDATEAMLDALFQRFCIGK